MIALCLKAARQHIEHHDFDGALAELFKAMGYNQSRWESEHSSHVTNCCMSAIRRVRQLKRHSH